MLNRQDLARLLVCAHSQHIHSVPALKHAVSKVEGLVHGDNNRERCSWMAAVLDPIQAANLTEHEASVYDSV